MKVQKEMSSKLILSHLNCMQIYTKAMELPEPYKSRMLEDLKYIMSLIKDD